MIGHGGWSQIMKSLSGLGRAGAEELIREGKVSIIIVYFLRIYPRKCLEGKSCIRWI